LLRFYEPASDDKICSLIRQSDLTNIFSVDLVSLFAFELAFSFHLVLKVTYVKQNYAFEICKFGPKNHHRGCPWVALNSVNRLGEISPFWRYFLALGAFFSKNP
jgi:hypothetical protein